MLAAPYYNKERIETIMTNQEIFKMLLLSENESRLFYALCDDRDNKALKAAHESVKQALINFARDTGCNNKTKDKKECYLMADGN